MKEYAGGLNKNGTKETEKKTKSQNQEKGCPVKQGGKITG